MVAASAGACFDVVLVVAASVVVVVVVSDSQTQENRQSR